MLVCIPRTTLQSFKPPMRSHAKTGQQKSLKHCMRLQCQGCDRQQACAATQSLNNAETALRSRHMLHPAGLSHQLPASRLRCRSHRCTRHAWITGAPKAEVVRSDGVMQVGAELQELQCVSRGDIHDLLCEPLHVGLTRHYFSFFCCFNRKHATTSCCAPKTYMSTVHHPPIKRYYFMLSFRRTLPSKSSSSVCCDFERLGTR